MDFAFDPLPAEFGAAVERLVNAEIARRTADRRRLPAAQRRPSPTPDLIRTKVDLIPAARSTQLRVVDIVGLDRQADGGTHVLSTAEVGARAGRGHREQGQGQQAHPHRGAGRPTRRETA